MAGQENEASVSAHYTPRDLGEKILAGLRAAGKDPDALHPDDLAPVDQFHIGGRQATQELIERAGLRADMQVLDVGGGLGGPARLLASLVGCAVTVLDLTEEYCHVGEMLTARTGMSDRVTFRHGSALAMPFTDGSFDAIWTQHSSMNIADKERLYAEMYRVLRPGGRLAIHEVMAGPVQPIHFPVPWAREQTISFLRSPEDMRHVIARAGFREIVWEEAVPSAQATAQARAAPSTASAPPSPLGIQLLLGPAFPEMARNFARNIQEGRVIVIQAVFERV
ncbi:MAG: class I SAM-dependent methyltransferase [Thermomicrobiales bacterium]